jgi:hypothetical protein
MSWLASAETHLALLLTTNNLSPSNVASKLDVQNFASGVAMLIEQSEVTEDITDKQGHYLQIETELWDITNRWMELYNSTAEFTEEWDNVGDLPIDASVSVKFTEPKTPVSEGEKLDNLKKRDDLGINEKIDLIMIDNPDLSREEAKEKLMRIQEEKLQRFSASFANAVETTQSDEGDDGSAEG